MAADIIHTKKGVRNLVAQDRVRRLTHLGYKFPNDEREQDRLDMLHHMFKLVLNDRLFLAPIENGPIRVLDIGTGTGLWAIEFGTSFDVKLAPLTVII